MADTHKIYCDVLYLPTSTYLFTNVKICGFELREALNPLLTTNMKNTITLHKEIFKKLGHYSFTPEEFEIIERVVEI